MTTLEEKDSTSEFTQNNRSVKQESMKRHKSIFTLAERIQYHVQLISKKHVHRKELKKKNCNSNLFVPTGKKCIP